jgi:hypothetical protein
MKTAIGDGRKVNANLRIGGGLKKINFQTYKNTNKPTKSHHAIISKIWLISEILHSRF